MGLQVFYSLTRTFRKLRCKKTGGLLLVVVSSDFSRKGIGVIGRAKREGGLQVFECWVHRWGLLGTHSLFAARVQTEPFFWIAVHLYRRAGPRRILLAIQAAEAASKSISTEVIVPGSLGSMVGSTFYIVIVAILIQEVICSILYSYKHDKEDYNTTTTQTATTCAFSWTCRCRSLPPKQLTLFSWSRPNHPYRS